MMRTVSILSALALAGCASPPESRLSELPVSYPEQWEAQQAAALITDGWAGSFNDAQLTQLIETAITNNWNLRQSAAQLAIVQAERGIVRADQLPGFTGSGDAARSRGVTDSPLTGQPVANTANRYSVSLGVRWELDVWGRLRNLDSAAIADVQAAQADYAGARQSLAAQVARVWFDLAEAQQQAALAQKTFESFQSNAQLIEDRFQRGVGSALDLRLTRANAQSARASYHARLQQTDALRRLLAVLLGQYPEASYVTAANLPATPSGFPADVPASVLARRPDLIAAERNLAAAGKRQAAAEKALLPSISLTSSAGTSSSQLEDLLNGDYRVWSLAGNLAAPIWQGGAIRAGISKAEAAEELALAVYAQTALEAFREVETALAAAAFLREQEEALAIAAREASEAEQLAWDRYSRGVESIITALQAQRTAFTEQSRLITAKNERLQNRINLYLALGGEPTQMQRSENLDTK